MEYLKNRIKKKNAIIDKDFFTKEFFTLYTKIEICSLAGFIAPHEYKALHAVRKIRNEFAHPSKHLTFDTSEIEKYIPDLVTYWTDLTKEPRIKKRSNRYYFVTIVSLLCKIFLNPDIRDEFIKVKHEVDKLFSKNKK